MNYKVGDKVVVRTDLKVGKRYGTDSFVNDMVGLKVVTIANVRAYESKYNVEENGYSYTDEMLSGLLFQDSKGILTSPTKEYPRFEDALQRTFSTGAVRDTAEGKPRMGLIPKDLLRRVAKLYTKGAELYGADNWRKGQPKDATMDSLERHLEAYRRGETDEDHLSAVIWNAFSMMNVDEYLLKDHPELDFEFKYPKKGV